jgi:hypothetical protein
VNIVQEPVRDGAKPHTLVMCHIGFHHLASFAAFESFRSEIDCFIKAIWPFSSTTSKGLKVSHRGSRIDHRGQESCIRSDDEIFSQAAFQAETGNTE